MEREIKKIQKNSLTTNWWNDNNRRLLTEDDKNQSEYIDLI